MKGRQQQKCAANQFYQNLAFVSPRLGFPHLIFNIDGYWCVVDRNMISEKSKMGIRVDGVQRYRDIRKRKKTISPTARERVSYALDSYSFFARGR